MTFSICFPASHSTHDGKHLLLQEQILDFKSWSLLKRETNMKMTVVALESFSHSAP